MKNKQIICCAGYVVSCLLVLLVLFTEFPRPVDLAIGVLFSMIFAVSHVQFLHNRMLRKDQDYKISVLDERNVAIKEKAGNITNMVNLVLLGCVAVLFIALDYMVPAMIIGGVIVIQPIVLIFASNSIEKKM